MTTADFALKTITGWGITDRRVLKQPPPAKQTTLSIIDQLDANRIRAMNKVPANTVVEDQGYIKEIEPEGKELITLQNPWYTGPTIKSGTSIMKPRIAPATKIPKPPKATKATGAYKIPKALREPSAPASVVTPVPTSVLTNTLLPYKKRVSRGFR